MKKYLFFIISLNIKANPLLITYNCKSLDPIMPDFFSITVQKDILFDDVIEFSINNLKAYKQHIKTKNKDHVLEIIISLPHLIFSKKILFNQESKIANMSLIDKSKKEYKIAYSYACEVKE